mmetsp:Transcript_9188/g.9258  ORF Transcript_9188/g.9258 Transcript_9188/m.9258 type:complete len:220 (+) Transcript_9188:54-713(+)
MKLTSRQKLFAAPYFAINALANPMRADMVAALGDSTGYYSLKKICSKMKNSRSGRKILLEKPIISSESLNLPYLRSLPSGQFGREYIRYMDHNGFDADERPSVRFLEDEELAYVMLRYRQIHDFWHVLSGLPPTVFGEIALKWLEWRVTALPVCGLSSLAGPLRLSSEDRGILRQEYIPWALECGGNCEDLMSYPYEENFNRTVEEIRIDLNFIPAPKI